MSASGALLGLVFASAAILISSGVMAHRRPRLAVRLRGPRRVHIEQGPIAALQQILGTPLGRWLSREGVDLSSRLRSAGRDVDPDRYHLEQIVAASIGAAAGVTLAIAFGMRGGGISGGAVIALFISGAIGGWIFHDRSLTRATRQRGARMAEQLPTVAELVAFAVAAGEAPLAAIDRVASTVRGDLAREFATAVRRVRGGSTFPAALRLMADDVPSHDVARFVDGIAVASERGTPLAEVLRAQAADARAGGRRLLLEQAGRKEVLMLVPVVFFILPIVVIIALYPGLHGLQLTV
jgi:tight adherence protein C